VPVVGYIIAGTEETTRDVVAALRRGMSETGFVEGRNVAVEYRWTNSVRGRATELAVDLIQRRVSVIAASTAAAALAAKAATSTIPIVFYAGADAVRAGLVTNLSRPDSNLTGVNSMTVEVGAKRLGLLHELLPQAQRLGMLVNLNVPDVEDRITIAQVAAKTMGLPLEVFTASTNREIDAAFADAVEKRIDALTIANAQFFAIRRVQIVTLAVRHAIPAIHAFREDVEAGGLMSYGTSLPDAYRQMGIYVGRLLKGEKPADLPVIQPTRFEFVINLQTAKLLGLTVPPGLLAIADEVIE
jgi:putative ABC transport system substrate-binding protein